MDLVQEITIAITSAVESHGLILEEVTVASPGNRRLITCVVDSLESINLDDVTVASKEISSILDAADFLGETPFTLEVTSPGVDRPLTQPRHWLKNLNRLVRSVMVNGEVVTGRVDAVHDESVCVVVPGKVAKKVELPFVEIKRAHVEIEFNRKGEDI
ncbi:MAG: ribosome maturation factor RimP [Candidatus Nanopelagicaceae bacterium]|nr:ribosome maturation factor RimP [Candidatus Nanopelagicaceae bacterium]